MQDRPASVVIDRRRDHFPVPGLPGIFFPSRRFRRPEV